MRSELSNGSVTLRRCGAEDIPAVYEAVRESVADIGRWMSWAHPAYSMDDSAAWVLSRDEAWANGSEYNFLITGAQDGKLLGVVSINFIRRDHNFGNLGYWVRSCEVGRGVATAATLLMARFGFEELGLSRIEIVVAVGNEVSQRVAEKVGAKMEGILRNRLTVSGQPHEAVMYSLIPSDFSG